MTRDRLRPFLRRPFRRGGPPIHRHLLPVYERDGVLLERLLERLNEDQRSSLESMMKTVGKHAETLGRCPNRSSESRFKPRSRIGGDHRSASNRPPPMDRGLHRTSCPNAKMGTPWITIFVEIGSPGGSIDNRGGKRLHGNSLVSASCDRSSVNSEAWRTLRLVFESIRPDHSNQRLSSFAQLLDVVKTVAGCC